MKDLVIRLISKLYVDTSGIPGYGVVVMENKYYIEHGLDADLVNCVGMTEDGDFTMEQPLWKAYRFTNKGQAEITAKAISKAYDTCAYVFPCDATFYSRLSDMRAAINYAEKNS